MVRRQKSGKKLIAVVCIIGFVIVLVIGVLLLIYEKKTEQLANLHSMDSFTLLKNHTPEQIEPDPMTGKKKMVFKNFKLQAPYNDAIVFEFPSDWNAKITQWGVHLGNDPEPDTEIFLSIHYPVETFAEEVTAIKKNLSKRGIKILSERKSTEGNKSVYVYYAEIVDRELYATPNSGPFSPYVAIVALGQTRIGLSLRTIEHKEVFDSLLDSIQKSETDPSDPFVTLNYATCISNQDEVVSPTGITKINMLGLRIIRFENTCSFEVTYTPHDKKIPKEHISCSVPTSWQDHQYYITKNAIDLSRLKRFTFLCSFNRNWQ